MRRKISLPGVLPGEPDATVVAPKGADIHTGHSQDPAGTRHQEWGTTHRGVSSYGAPAGFGTLPILGRKQSQASRSIPPLKESSARPPPPHFGDIKKCHCIQGTPESWKFSLTSLQLLRSLQEGGKSTRDGGGKKSKDARGAAHMGRGCVPAGCRWCEHGHLHIPPSSSSRLPAILRPPRLEAALGLEPFPSTMCKALVAITTGFRLQK